MNRKYKTPEEIARIFDEEEIKKNDDDFESRLNSELDKMMENRIEFIKNLKQVYGKHESDIKEMHHAVCEREGAVEDYMHWIDNNFIYNGEEKYIL